MSHSQAGTIQTDPEKVTPHISDPEKVTSHISVDALDLDKVESPGWGANRAAGTEAAAPSLSGDTNGDVNSSAEEPNRKLIGHRRKSNGPGFVFSQGQKERGHGLHGQSEYALNTDEESGAAAFVLSVGIRAIEAYSTGWPKLFLASSRLGGWFGCGLADLRVSKHVAWHSIFCPGVIRRQSNGLPRRRPHFEDARRTCAGVMGTR